MTVGAAKPSDSTLGLLLSSQHMPSRHTPVFFANWNVALISELGLAAGTTSPGMAASQSPFPTQPPPPGVLPLAMQFPCQCARIAHGFPGPKGAAPTRVPAPKAYLKDKSPVRYVLWASPTSLSKMHIPAVIREQRLGRGHTRMQAYSSTVHWTVKLIYAPPAPKNKTF